MINIKENNIIVSRWLFSCCLMIGLMILIGGLTRLTMSGLSMTDWNIITGILPPLSHTEWLEEFAKYQQTPEFKLINFDFTLTQYQEIFWLEYFHRILGRLTGFVFILPFIYFILAKKITKKQIIILSSFLLMGALQGLAGWFMVKSGLKDIPNVSHFWLSFHLLNAFIIFSIIFYYALGLNNNKKGSNNKLVYFCYGLLTILTLQVIYGGFVAGLDAGLIYNEFPMMGDSIIATEAFSKFTDILKDPVTIQAIHRIIGTLIILLSICFLIFSFKFNLTKKVKCAIVTLQILFLLQYLLGVATLISQLNIVLAASHQVTALIITANILYLIFYIRREKIVQLR